MSVDQAEAALALAKAEEAWQKAKADGKKDAAYKKAQAELVKARDVWRTEFRDAG